MAIPETSHRFQTALLWEATGRFDEYGQHVVESSFDEIEVRWENKRREVIDANGNTVMLDAFVHVDQVVRIGSVMWLGDTTDWQGTGSGAVPSDLMRVVVKKDTPNVFGTSWRRTLGLQRISDTLPT